jgi:tRNA(His) 5'-end guanylyltransferase
LLPDYFAKHLNFFFPSGEHLYITLRSKLKGIVCGDKNSAFTDIAEVMFNESPGSRINKLKFLGSADKLSALRASFFCSDLDNFSQKLNRFGCVGSAAKRALESTLIDFLVL